jgi:hypothetical protein
MHGGYRRMVDIGNAKVRRGKLFDEFIQSNLPFSFYISLIELYQLRIEDFSCREGEQA